MYIKEMTYVDFMGETRTEKFYFNLSQAEILDLQISENGGLSGILEKIMEERNNKELSKYFKDIVLMSYGERSNDGKYFRKSKEILDNFTSTQAFSDFYVKLASDAEFAAEFINGVVPKDLPKTVIGQTTPQVATSVNHGVVEINAASSKN